MTSEKFWIRNVKNPPIHTGNTVYSSKHGQPAASGNTDAAASDRLPRGGVPMPGEEQEETSGGLVRCLS